MDRPIVYNSDLHFEHGQWASELAFWEDELKSFNHRLEELVQRWTKREVLKELEHFQNEFDLHAGVIEQLYEAIEAHETRIAAQEKTGRASVDTQLFQSHLKVREKMEGQRQIYADLKKGFFLFLTKYM